MMPDPGFFYAKASDVRIESGEKENCRDGTGYAEKGSHQITFNKVVIIFQLLDAGNALGGENKANGSSGFHKNQDDDNHAFQDADNGSGIYMLIISILLRKQCEYFRNQNLNRLPDKTEDSGITKNRPKNRILSYEPVEASLMKPQDKPAADQNEKQMYRLVVTEILQFTDVFAEQRPF